MDDKKQMRAEEHAVGDTPNGNWRPGAVAVTPPSYGSITRQHSDDLKQQEFEAAVRANRRSNPGAHRIDGPGASSVRADPNRCEDDSIAVEMGPSINEIPGRDLDSRAPVRKGNQEQDFFGATRAAAYGASSQLNEHNAIPRDEAEFARGDPEQVVVGNDSPLSGSFAMLMTGIGNQSANSTSQHLPADAQSNIIPSRVMESSVPMKKSENAEGKRCNCKWIWISVLVLLVVVGAIVGGVVASSLNSKTSKSPASNNDTISTTYGNNQGALNQQDSRVIAAQPLIEGIISSAATLRDPSSSQYAAFSWITTSDTMSPIQTNGNDAAAIEKLQQRYALAVFYYSLAGNTWKSSSDWLNGKLDECKWEAIQCNSDGQVVALGESNLLQENNLSGEIPSELSHLPELGKLDSSAFVSIFLLELNPFL